MRRKLGDVTNTASGKKRKKTKTRHASKKRRRAEKDTSETGSNDSSQDEDSQDSDDANGSSSGVEEAADKGALTRVGRLYVLQYGLWVKGGVHIFEQVPDPKYDEKKRFETDTTKIQGQLRDIQKIIPAAYFGKEGRMGGKELVARAVSAMISRRFIQVLISTSSSCRESIHSGRIPVHGFARQLGPPFSTVGQLTSCCPKLDSTSSGTKSGGASRTEQVVDTLPSMWLSCTRTGLGSTTSRPAF